MSTDGNTGSERSRFNFVKLVRQNFAFLADFGFCETEARPKIVRYRKTDLDLNVYHGRQSYEVGVQIEQSGERYAVSELIRVTDPMAAEKYRNPVATTSPALASGVERVASLVRRYGERALRSDPDFFADLKSQRKSWAEAYALDVLAEQIRPKAEVAFREGRYREAAELYEKRLSSGICGPSGTDYAGLRGARSARAFR